MNNSVVSYRPLQKMFINVPPTYDFLNRLLTFRFDVIWRRKAARQCFKNNPDRILDLCCGTGDLTMELRKLAYNMAEVSALDFSAPMLDLAKKKAIKKRLTNIIFHQGDAAAMPFPDAYFDSIGIGFAFRNLSFRNPDRDKFLEEILRVLNSGGRFVIVETSQPGNIVIRKFLHLYMRYFAQPVGSIISKHPGAYKYFAHSVINYYNKEEISDLLMKAGFSSVECIPLLFGIAGIFVATK